MNRETLESFLSENNITLSIEKKWTKSWATLQAVKVDRGNAMIPEEVCIIENSEEEALAELARTIAGQKLVGEQVPEGILVPLGLGGVEVATRAAAIKLVRAFNQVNPLFILLREDRVLIETNPSFTQVLEKVERANAEILSALADLYPEKVQSHEKSPSPNRL